MGFNKADSIIRDIRKSGFKTYNLADEIYAAGKPIGNYYISD